MLLVSCVISTEVPQFSRFKDQGWWHSAEAFVIKEYVLFSPLLNTLLSAVTVVFSRKSSISFICHSNMLPPWVTSWNSVFSNWSKQVYGSDDHDVGKAESRLSFSVKVDRGRKGSHLLFLEKYSHFSNWNKNLSHVEKITPWLACC